MIGVPWPLWGCACLIVAGIYTVVQPHGPACSSAWLRFILRWGHAAVWLVLAASCFVRVLEGAGVPDLANLVALLALTAYAGWLGVFLITRRRPA